MKKFKFNSPEVIKRKIRSVAGQLSPSFDGGILATIMKMIYYQGIKLKEILILKIGDVFSRGRILKRFNPTNPFQLRLLNDYIILIQCHLDYLKENHYSLKNGAPLFPKLKTNGNKNKSSAYKDNKIAKHLKERAGITWEQLRRDGVHHYYLLLTWQGYSNQDIINLLAWYFRENKKEIHTILKQGGITLTGVDLNPIVETSDPEPTPVETEPQEQEGIKSPIQIDYSSELERLERRVNEMRNQEQKEDYDDEDGTDLSKPIFDPYFFGDDYDYD